jgi:hypothetical protein
MVCLTMMTNQRFRSGYESSGILFALRLAMLVYSVDSCLSNVAGVDRCRQRNVVMRDK